MNLTLTTASLAGLAAIFAVVAFCLRWREVQRRPFGVERSPAKGSPQGGVLYAFTLGMAPWAKESTRRHWLPYLRGIAFHVGIFAGLAALLSVPAWPRLPLSVHEFAAALIGLGALCGLLGAVARWVEPNLRALSTPDDHAAVLLVTFFLGTTSLALLNAAWLPAMFLASAAMLGYAPLGKIRHCIYFFFSRRFFGLFVGRRSILHPEAAK